MSEHVDTAFLQYLIGALVLAALLGFILAWREPRPIGSSFAIGLIAFAGGVFGTLFWYALRNSIEFTIGVAIMAAFVFILYVAIKLGRQFNKNE